MEEHFSRYEVFYACESVKDIVNISGTEKAIKTDLDSIFYAKTVILAVGLEPKQMNKPFEKQFLGRGISYYAQCDGESYRGKDVVVVGGGNCACYAAEYLSEFVNKLYLVHRSDYIKAVKFLSAKMFNNPKIHILWNTDVEDVFGLDRVEKVKLYNHGSNQHTWVDVKAVFVYVGRIPPKNIISPELDVDEDGYVITDEFMRTNIKGVYAAGDIRSKQIRQIATAVADGMIAAINAERDLLR
jgi:thioredoxin reductase (NADPH)